MDAAAHPHFTAAAGNVGAIRATDPTTRGDGHGERGTSATGGSGRAATHGSDSGGTAIRSSGRAANILKRRRPSVEISAIGIPIGAATCRNAGQEIEQLKASIEQLKVSIEQLTAGQQQISRDIAKASEQNLRPKTVPPPRRPAVRGAQVAAALSRPQATLAPISTQAAAPYVPRRPEPAPQDTGDPLVDPDLASVPRPPMPLR